MIIIVQTELTVLDYSAEKEAYAPWEGGHEPPENIRARATITPFATDTEAEAFLQANAMCGVGCQIFEVTGTKAEDVSDYWTCRMARVHDARTI